VEVPAKAASADITVAIGMSPKDCTVEPLETKDVKIKQ
jgi:hypothetical protein